MAAELVGRHEEVALLRDRYAGARAGHGAVVLVAGEAGIGKTTLVDQFRRDIAGDGVRVLAGRAVSDEGVPELWLVRHLLGGGAPEMLGLLDVDPGTAGTSEPAAARFGAISRTVLALRAAAEPGGLVLTLDDLHWADEASLLLLRHLGADIRGSRLLIVGTFRDPDGAAGLPAGLAALCALSTVEVVRLGPLAVSEVAAVLSGAGPVDPTWPAHVHRRTGGNPLYVRELARVLTQHGVLADPARDLPLPTELRRLIGYRLARLSEDCQRLLGVCSAVGDEVDAGLLDEVADLLPGPVAPLLAEAVAAGVLVEDPEAPAVLRFSHAVVREARYESLDRVERLAVHRRIAGELEAGTPGDERAGERARHRIRAAVDPASRQLAALACRSAAEAARRRRAVDEAQRWYGRALELWGTDGDEPGRAALLVDAAAAAYGVGLVAEALARCAAAADVAERIGRPDLVAAAALVVRGIGGSGPNAAIVRLCERARAVLPEADVAGHAQLLAQQAFATSEVADAQAAEPLSAQALALAERSGDPGALVSALHARHQVLVGPEHVVQRLGLGTRLRALAPATGRQDAALWGHLWHIEAQFQLGAVESLDEELRELAELADGRGGPMPRWHLRRAQAARAIIDGRFADAAQLAGEARDIAAQIQDESAQFVYYAQVADLVRLTGGFDELRPRVVEVATALPLPVAWAGASQFLLQSGDREAALHLYERARAALPTLPRNTRWFPTVGLTAAVAARLGDAETASRCYELLRPGTRYFVNSAAGVNGSVARILGEVTLALGRLDEADLLLGQAVTMETRIGALPFVVLAQVSHATVLARRDAPGDRDRARRLCERAGRTAQRLGMAPAADAAAAVAAGLAATARSGQPQLTAREREIAALVAQGLANRAIAGELVLSERTVEAHVRSILAKLGMSNRTQVAAWAVRTGAGPVTAPPHAG